MYIINILRLLWVSVEIVFSIRLIGAAFILCMYRKWMGVWSFSLSRARRASGNDHRQHCVSPYVWLAFANGNWRNVEGA